MWKDFKAFAFKGNLIDLAVAVVIGAAFGRIITALVDNIIMPLIGMLLGGTDLTSLAVSVGRANLTYGFFLQECLNFLIIAFAIFLAIRMLAKAGLFAKKEEPAPAPDPGPTEAELLTEIRDLLKEK